MGVHVGIDLGTTYSAVSYFDKSVNKPVIIKNTLGYNITPSVLHFANGQFEFGQEAKAMLEVDSYNTVAFFKREMGNKDYNVALGGKSLAAQDLSAIFLKMLIQDAAEALGQDITSAVITVPAYFKHQQREATKLAGELAGLKVLRIINEPTAAALAYGLTGADQPRTVLVYDLGGGTFDVTIVRISADEITVLGTDGDHYLGGKNWDDAIAVHFRDRFMEAHGIDLLDSTDEYYQLLLKAEQAKIQLTSRDQVRVSLIGGGLRHSFDFTVAELDSITTDLLARTEHLTESLLKDCNMTWSNLDGVLLVGGSTRMRMVGNFIGQKTGKEPLRGIYVDEVVAHGAAIQAEMDVNGASQPAYQLGGRRVSDVIAHSLGMVAINKEGTGFINQRIIEKQTTIPATETKPFSVNPRHCSNNETEVYVLQGEEERPLDCTLLGKYVISGIKLSGREAIIDVSYHYDMNGIVQVLAKQRETGADLPVRKEPAPGDMSWLDRSPGELKGKSEPVTIMLAVDLSGSMAGGPLRKAKAAIKELIAGLDLGNVKLGLVVFAESTDYFMKITDNYREIIKRVDDMDTGVVGYGTSAEPFTTAMAALGRFNNKKYILVLTDGAWSYRDKAIQQAKTCRSQGIEIIAIGFGAADHSFLQEIASSSENAMMTSLENLTQSFVNIAQVVSTSGLQSHQSGLWKR